MSIKPQIKHYGKVRNGKISFHNEQLWEQQRWALEGKEFELIIKQRHRPVSNDQYGYYYGGILTTCFNSEIFSAFDKSADIHIYFEDKFLSYKTMLAVGNNKKEIVRHRSLTSLNKTEMSEFIDRVLIHCRTDLQIEVLAPDQYYLSLYKTKEK